MPLLSRRSLVPPRLLFESSCLSFTAAAASCETAASVGSEEAGSACALVKECGLLAPPLEDLLRTVGATGRVSFHRANMMLCLLYRAAATAVDKQGPKAALEALRGNADLYLMLGPAANGRATASADTRFLSPKEAFARLLQPLSPEDEHRLHRRTRVGAAEVVRGLSTTPGGNADRASLLDFGSTPLDTTLAPREAVLWWRTDLLARGLEPTGQPAPRVAFVSRGEVNVGTLDSVASGASLLPEARSCRVRTHAGDICEVQC